MSIYKKIHQIQKNRLQVAKTCKANLGGGRVYEYASLDDVLAEAIPALSDAGLVLVQSVVPIDNMQFVRTEIVDPETGEKIQSDIAMPSVSKWHDFGSGMTYARRYGLSAILGIACDADDDANITMQKPAEKPKLMFFPVLKEFIARLSSEGFEITQDEAVNTIWHAAGQFTQLKCKPESSTKDKGAELASILNSFGEKDFKKILEEAFSEFADVPGK